MYLKQIATINAGYPFRGKISEVSASKTVVVQMKNTMARGVEWDACIRVSLKGKRAPDYLRNGDILVVARGNKNYVVLIDETINTVKLQGFQAVAAPHFYVVRLKASEANQIGSVLPEYLAWFLNQGLSQRYFEQNAEGSVTKSIRRRIVEEVPIAVPTLERQQAIIELAENLYQKQLVIEKLKKNDELLLSSIASDLLKESEEENKKNNKEVIV